MRGWRQEGAKDRGGETVGDWGGLMVMGESEEGVVVAERGQGGWKEGREKC